MGNMKKKWLTNNEICNEQLLIWCNGLQNNPTSIIVEINAIPFLFSHGYGACDGKIPKHEYLEFHFILLFSPFTLYNHIY